MNYKQSDNNMRSSVLSFKDKMIKQRETVNEKANVSQNAENQSITNYQGEKIMQSDMNKKGNSSQIAKSRSTNNLLREYDVPILDNFNQDDSMMKFKHQKFDVTIEQPYLKTEQGAVNMMKKSFLELEEEEYESVVFNKPIRFNSPKKDTASFNNNLQCKPTLIQLQHVVQQNDVQIVPIKNEIYVDNSIANKYRNIVTDEVSETIKQNMRNCESNSIYITSFNYSEQKQTKMGLDFIQLLENDNIQLKQKIESLNTRIFELEDTIKENKNNQEFEIKQKQQYLDLKIKKIEQLQIEIKQFQERHEKQQMTMDLQKEEIQELKQKNENLTRFSITSPLRKQHSILEDQENENEQSYIQIENDLVEYKKINNALKEKNMLRLEKMAELNQKIEKDQRTIQEKDDEILKLQKQFQEISQKYYEMLPKCQDLQQENKSLKIKFEEKFFQDIMQLQEEKKEQNRSPLSSRLNLGSTFYPQQKFQKDSGKENLKKSKKNESISTDVTQSNYSKVEQKQKLNEPSDCVYFLFYRHTKLIFYIDFNNLKYKFQLYINFYLSLSFQKINKNFQKINKKNKQNKI